MIITTTDLSSDPRYDVTEYLGIVFGTDLYLIGGLLGFGIITQESLFGEAFEKAQDKMVEKAKKMGADAIIGVNSNVFCANAGGENVVLVVTGTAVKIKKSDQFEVNEIIAKEKMRQEEERKIDAEKRLKQENEAKQQRGFNAIHKCVVEMQSNPDMSELTELQLSLLAIFFDDKDTAWSLNELFSIISQAYPEKYDNLKIIRACNDLLKLKYITQKNGIFIARKDID